MILADDLGWADLGCYGSKFHRTPRLDRLAAEGRRFTQAYAACPVCSPTRAALMTGKHPARLHLTDWLPGRGDMPAHRLLRPAFAQQLPLDETTLAELLQSAGYATAHIGKWHLGGAGFEPTRQGFGLNIAGDDRGSPASYVAPFTRGGRPIPGLEQAPAGEYLTDRLTAEAEKFIVENQQQPFFLYMPHFAVHTPLVGQDELIQQYPAWDGTPHGKQENPIYAAMLESLDSSVGRILDKLAELKLSERTIVVFTSDNGGLATREGPNTPATINSPLREGKGWLYEGGIRVPLLAAWPGQISKGTEETPVWSADLLPTLLDLAGQTQPADGVDGVSLANLLLQGQPPEPRALYWHYPHYANQGSRPGGAIRRGDWKLIEFFDTGRHELFDVAHDIGEGRNRAADEPQRVAELAALLAAWRLAVGAQMPSPNPDYLPNPQQADGSVTLPAMWATVHGVMLRYEPLPHKQTLGYWILPDDWAEFEFELTMPGEFSVEALVGCGNGSGGSQVEFRLAEQTLKLTVPETGGFQQFKPQSLGRVKLEKPGRFTLEVRATSKPGPAVMDLRQIKLIPVKTQG
ncbi:MAG: sulfatase-like hydrolase/transferase [Pirellulales bacterium]